MSKPTILICSECSNPFQLSIMPGGQATDVECPYCGEHAAQVKPGLITVSQIAKRDRAFYLGLGNRHRLTQSDCEQVASLLQDKAG